MNAFSGDCMGDLRSVVTAICTPEESARACDNEAQVHVPQALKKVAYTLTLLDKGTKGNLSPVSRRARRISFEVE